MTKPNEQPLEPLAPREAIAFYEQDREDEVSEATLQSHGYRLHNFVRWCDKNDVENLNEIGGRDIQRFKKWRSEQVNIVTLKSQMDTLRVFLRFCESIDGVRDGVADSVRSPSLERVNVRDKDIVRENKASAILAYHDKYHYASVEHTLFRFLWETGCRMGAAHSVDLDDLHLRAEYVELNHRPETGTTLKNGDGGERAVALSTRTCNIIRDYIDEHRYDVEDDYGRRPLFTSKQGRLTKNIIRTYIYRVTRPCIYNGGSCPHDREQDDCEAMRRMYASKCPSSSAPHSIRRGAITHYLNTDTPGEVVSDRMNVSKDVIDEHYDSRTEYEKMELRRSYLDNL
ncbi:tyrosine-type recombinase/integrase [Haloferax sp. MBLA0076]|uniref:Tyrosine-type recombinase/integrase n=1 Tax=Haloferax litoreum TaxID=2666140 RepID=A0A6A8GFL6_9EURY|nr:MULTISPECIES: site-specific integrase [Haloferax]KAB1193220.1 site-specific integrase [Haloferax sp. CBA1148]MRX21719.1 tyrosine-type recombinase/integrase [Haloferax litoreum]